MAEVYGNIGDQPVELNNAASEATLNALLEVAKAQFNSQTKGKDARAQRDLEKKLKDLAAATVSATKTVKSEEQARDKSVRTIRQENEARRNSIITTENLKKATVKATNQLSDMAISISRMGDSVTAATSVLTSMVKQIPLIGGAVGGLVDNVAQAIEGTQKSFMAASSVGANFSASINDMINSASSAGLTIDQFTGIISSNGESLALLSSSSAEGAKRFADLGKAMRNSNIQDQLANLGFNTESINEGMANYIGIIGKSGRLQELNDRQLVELTGDYLKELDAVSKLTGQSRKDLEAENAARMRDAQVRITMSKLSADDQKQLHTLMNLIPEEHRKGFKDIVATGTATTEEAQKVFSFLPSLAKNAIGLNQQITRTGRIAADASERVYDQYQREASGLAKSDLGNLLAAYTQDAGTFMVAAMDVAAREGKTLEQVLAEVAKTAGDTSKEFGEMSPAQLVKTQQEIAESSNEMQRSFLRASGTLLTILENFQNGIQEAVGMLDDLSNWTEKAWKKIKEWIEIFDTEGVGGIFGRLTSAIFDGMKQGVGFLINKAIEIGEYLATGFVNNLPDWLKSFLQKESEEEAKERANAQASAASGGFGVNTPGATSGGGTGKSAYGPEAQAAIAAASKNQPAGGIADSRARMAAEQAASAWIGSNGGIDDSLENHAAELEKQAKKKAELDKEQKEATEDNTDATTANTSTVKAASTCELDYSSPQALFNSFAKIMVGGKAGVTDTMTGASAAATPQQLASMTEALSLTGGAGRISSRYGMRDHPVHGGRRMHKGVDIAAAEGTDVVAPEGGTARLKVQRNAKGDMTGYGNYIEILNEQKQVVHRLAHLSSAIMKEGEEIEITAGQVIGKVGNTGTSTGAHLHYEYLVNGKQVDPQLFFDQQQTLAKVSPNVTAGTAIPAVGQQMAAASTVTPSAAQAAESASQDKSGSATPTTPGPGAPAAVSSAASGQGMQTDALNTQMAQLIKSNSDLLAVANQQLRALRGMSSDGFVNA